jgi:hypothetical protein
MTNLTELQKNLLDRADQRSNARRIGFDEGVAHARAELQPQLEKMASDAVRELLAEEADNEKFRAQVAAHAAGAEILRAKTSMQEGFCWDCGTNKFSSRSPYRRCVQCDINDSDEAI